jgi:cullin-4
MIPSLLGFKQRIDAVLKGPFVNDADFGHSVQDAFEWFVNKRQNKPAEMIGEQDPTSLPDREKCK